MKVLIEEIPEIFLLGFILGPMILISLIFYNFIFIFPIFLIFSIKISILINLKNKYNEQLETRKLILQILKYSIIYKVLFQGLINIIFIIYSFIFKSNTNFIKIFISILTIILFLFLSYKSLYKKSKKIFKTKKFCIWYSILLIPSILITIIFNIILIETAYIVLYAT